VIGDRSMERFHLVSDVATATVLGHLLRDIEAMIQRGGADVVAGHQAIEAVDDVEPPVKCFDGLKGESAAHRPVLTHHRAYNHPSG
jgi:hypothetical protein